MFHVKEIVRWQELWRRVTFELGQMYNEKGETRTNFSDRFYQFRRDTLDWKPRNLIYLRTTEPKSAPPLLASIINQTEHISRLFTTLFHSETMFKMLKSWVTTVLCEEQLTDNEIGDFPELFRIFIKYLQHSKGQQAVVESAIENNDLLQGLPSA